MATHRTADKLIIADILEALQRQLAVAVGEARRRAVPAQRLAVDLHRVLRAQKVSVSEDSKPPAEPRKRSEAERVRRHSHRLGVLPVGALAAGCELFVRHIAPVTHER